MSPYGFAIVLLIAAFVLGVWIDFPWPQLAPKDIWFAVLHIAASAIASRLLLKAAFEIGAGSETAMVVAVIALILPALVYCLIAAIWVIKHAHRAMSGLRY